MIYYYILIDSFRLETSKNSKNYDYTSLHYHPPYNQKNNLIDFYIITHSHPYLIATIYDNYRFNINRNRFLIINDWYLLLHSLLNTLHTIFSYNSYDEAQYSYARSILYHPWWRILWIQKNLYCLLRLDFIWKYSGEIEK